MYILLMIILYANLFQLDDNCNVNFSKLDKVNTSYANNNEQ